jgi:hypothetical protein
MTARKKRAGIPVTIVTPKWKASELCRMVRNDVEGHWLTPEQGRQVIKDGKAQMVYTPPQGRARRGKS